MSQYRILSANDVCLFMIIREQLQPAPSPCAPLCLACFITTVKLRALHGHVAYSIPQKNIDVIDVKHSENDCK